LSTHTLPISLTCANLADILSTDKHYLYSDSYWWRGTLMSETGRTWRRPFKGLAIEAAEARAWTAKRATHDDAVQVAHELFVAGHDRRGIRWPGTGAIRCARSEYRGV